MNDNNDNNNDFTPPPADYGQLVKWFRQATPYINAHRDKTFVISLGGEALLDANISNIIHDIALLNSLNTRIVIVHGCRAQLQNKLAEKNISSPLVEGLRVTDAVTMNKVIEAASLVRSQLETRLSMGLAPSAMHSVKVRVASANVITAKPSGIINGVDLQLTGTVRNIDTLAITSLLDTGNIVLLSALGYSPSGDCFNLAYDHVATEIAQSLAADKLIAFTQSSGIHDHDGHLIRELTPASAAQLIIDQTLTPAMLPLARAAIAAVEGGVPRAHIMSYRDDGALLQELYSVDGAGTLISQANFEQIRSASADDVSAIIEMITPLEEQGVLVRREREKLAAEIDYFTVIERDGLIIAIAALYPYQTDPAKHHATLGEIACIVTHADYRNGNRGARLLETIENQAQAMGIEQVFVLTTQTAHWFIENGFNEGSVAELPKEKQLLYNYQRNAKVLFKPPA
ncbi:MAG: amino-acid N-acetyltransferase [Pseudomonadales bacterium]|nr:amino-acid N-acetyltransferase [Pseudomonadales bacterium]